MKTNGEPSFKTLIACRSGIAAVEMALIAPFFVILLGGMVDVGLLLHEKAQVSQATSAGLAYAVLAEQAGATIGSISTNVETMIQDEVNTGFTSGTNVAITINNGNTSSDVCCITFTGGTASWNCAASAPTCGDGSNAGLYLQAQTTYSFTPLFPEDIFLPKSIRNVAFRRIK